ncbi:MAG: hypothetical protein WC568_11470 [Candidatus Methanoperedens sp.]
MRICNLAWGERERLVQGFRWAQREDMLAHDGECAGVGELGIEKELDKVVQFERFGFVRIDGVSGDGVVADFTHM